MECDITDVNSSSQRHAKGLDGAIQVLVVQSVLIVPDSGRWIDYFVTHKPDAIIAWVRLDLIHYGACSGPGHDSRLHSHGRAERRKREIVNAGYAELAIGDVVIHVALPGMRLAPCVFMRAEVCRFSEVGRIRVEVCIQVVDLDPDPVRHAVMGVAGMIVGARWERAGERIDPCARTDLALVAI